MSTLQSYAVDIEEYTKQFSVYPKDNTSLIPEKTQTCLCLQLLSHFYQKQALSRRRSYSKRR